MTDEHEQTTSDSAIIITKNNALPSTKSVKFTRTTGMELVAEYDAPDKVPCSAVAKRNKGFICKCMFSKVPRADVKDALLLDKSPVVKI